MKDINDTGRGRTYCVTLAKQLSSLDLHIPLLTEEEQKFELQPSPKQEVKTGIPDAIETEISNGKTEISDGKTEISGAVKTEILDDKTEEVDALSRLSIK